MKSITVVAFVVAFGFANPVWAKRLSKYECTSYLAAQTCKEGCHPVKSLTDGARFEVDFLINEQKNLVMVRTYNGSSQPFHTHVLKNCSIFDTANWDCTEQIARGKGVITHLVESMTNGQYLSGVYHSPIGTHSGLGSCAK